MIRIIPDNTHKENDSKNDKKYNQTKPKKVIILNAINNRHKQKMKKINIMT